MLEAVTALFTFALSAFFSSSIVLNLLSEPMERYMRIGCDLVFYCFYVNRNVAYYVLDGDRVGRAVLHCADIAGCRLCPDNPRR